MATNNPISNCLVTKLTASIDGDMPRLGEFIVEFDTINNPQNKDMYICLSYIVGGSGYVRLLTSGNLMEYSTSNPAGTNVGTQLVISDNSLHCIVVPNGGKIAIGNKYDLANFSLYSYYATDPASLNWGTGRLTHKKVKADDLVYCTNLKTLSVQSATIVGTLNLSLLTELTEVGLNNSTATLTADMFSQNYKITSLQLQGSSVTGDFAPVFDSWADLLNGTYKKVTRFRITNTEATVNGDHYGANVNYIEFQTDGTWDMNIAS